MEKEVKGMRKNWENTVVEGRRKLSMIGECIHGKEKIFNEGESSLGKEKVV